MKQLIHMELRKLVRTKRFWICIAIGAAVCTLNLLYMAGVQEMIQESKMLLEEYYGSGANPDIPAVTLYNSWIGNEGYTFGFSVMYIIFPLLCGTAYGWSLHEEIRSGYLKNVAARCGRQKYFFAKWFCTFLSGGLVMIVPLLYNFIGVAMFIPAVKPDLSYPYYTMFQRGFMSDLYCEHPLMFNGVYLLLTFIYCGLIASLSFACCYFVRYKIIAAMVPFALFMAAHYLSGFATSVNSYEWSPLYLIHPTPVRWQNSGWHLLIYMAVMAAITVIVLCVKGNKRYEIY